MPCTASRRRRRGECRPCDGVSVWSPSSVRHSVRHVNGADSHEDRLLTTAEVAEILGVTPRTVQRKVHTGQIPIVKVMPGGRHGEYVFRESDIETLTEEATNDPAVSGGD